MTKTLLILGGQFAGLRIAHRLLKNTLPSVTDLRVILVNTSTHFYWNLAAVRAVVPNLIKDEDMFLSISDGFKYSTESFEFVVGTAESVDIENKIVSISTSTGLRDQVYDYLVITTGSKTIGDVPWKTNGMTYERVLDDLHTLQEKVSKADSIVVGGAGATGVEMAAELGFEYRTKKDIILVTSGDTILTGTLPIGQIKSSEAELEKLDVKIVRNVKVTGSATTSDGQTEVMLSDGKKILTDLYLPTVGLVRNTGFLPKELVNSQGAVIVDENLAVKSAKDVWAAGDVLDIYRMSALFTEEQADHVAKNIDLVLKGKAPMAYKVPTKDKVFITLGRSKGVGNMMGWKVPSSVVWFAKGRTMLVEKGKVLADGSFA